MASRNDEAPRSLRPFAIYLVVFYAVWVLRVILIWPLEDLLPSAWERQVSSDVIKILIWVVPVFMYLRRVDREKPLLFFKLLTWPVQRRIEATVTIVVYLGMTALLAIFVQHKTLVFQRDLSAGAWAYALFFTPISAIAEEIMFRGFVQQKLRAVYAFPRANLLTSGLFVLIHWPGWLHMGGFRADLIMLSVGVFLIAWFLGLLVERTNSLWPSVVLHTLNNLLFGG